MQQFNIADELKYPKVVIYKPQHNTALKEVICMVEEKYSCIFYARSNVNHVLCSYLL